MQPGTSVSYDAESGLVLAGYPRHRENRENDQNNSLSGKTQGIWIFCQNTGNLVCSSCKFPDSKGKRYFNICRENFHFFSRSWIGLPGQFCVCNSHKLCKLAQGKRYFDICRENFHFFPRSWIGLPGQFCVCNTIKLCKLAQRKFAVRQGKTGKTQGI